MPSTLTPSSLYSVADIFSTAVGILITSFYHLIYLFTGECLRHEGDLVHLSTSVEPNWGQIDHRIDRSLMYSRDSDLQLEKINVYLHKANGGRLNLRDLFKI